MKIAKWGNSLAVRLPKAMVERLGLKEGDEVEVALTMHYAREEAERAERMQDGFRVPGGPVVRNPFAGSA